MGIEAAVDYKISAIESATQRGYDIKNGDLHFLSSHFVWWSNLKSILTLMDKGLPAYDTTISEVRQTLCQRPGDSYRTGSCKFYSALSRMCYGKQSKHP